MAPSSVLVTGGTRGIGLGFVRHFLNLKDVRHVLATARDPDSATVAKILGNEGLTLLINNSGVFETVEIDSPPDRKKILNCLDVNVAGPIVVSQVFLPLLRKASSAHSSLPVGIDRAAIVNISSGAGSISDNGRGGMVVYRASKSALNSLSKTFALHTIEDDILTVAILPGYVVTRMTDGKGELTKWLEVEQSVGLMTKALESFGREQNGGFFGKDGKPFPL